MTHLCTILALLSLSFLPQVPHRIAQLTLFSVLYTYHLLSYSFFIPSFSFSVFLKSPNLSFLHWFDFLTIPPQELLWCEVLLLLYCMFCFLEHLPYLTSFPFHLGLFCFFSVKVVSFHLVEVDSFEQFLLLSEIKPFWKLVFPPEFLASCLAFFMPC